MHLPADLFTSQWSESALPFSRDVRFTTGLSSPVSFGHKCSLYPFASVISQLISHLLSPKPIFMVLSPSYDLSLLCACSLPFYKVTWEKAGMEEDTPTRNEPMLNWIDYPLAMDKDTLGSRKRDLKHKKYLMRHSFLGYLISKHCTWQILLWFHPGEGDGVPPKQKPIVRNRETRVSFVFSLC